MFNQRKNPARLQEGKLHASMKQTLGSGQACEGFSACSWIAVDGPCSQPCSRWERVLGREVSGSSKRQAADVIIAAHKLFASAGLYYMKCD